MKLDRSIGVIVFCRFPRSVKYLILKHKKGHWAFCKGHPDNGETKLETAIRELYEETGIKKVTFLGSKIEEKEEYNIIKNGKKLLKIVEYFAAAAENDKVRIDKKEILNYKWCTLEGAKKILTYPASYKILKSINKRAVKYAEENL